jgi:uncharacterized protein involved in exopolysaccharide biosynthesis
MQTQDTTRIRAQELRADDFGPAVSVPPPAAPAATVTPAGVSSSRGAAGDDPWIPPLLMGDFNLGLEVKATLRLLLRRRLPITILTGLAIAVGVVLTFVLPSVYESRALLLPSGSDDNLSAMGLGQAAGLASSFGINLGTPSMAMAYPDMLKSRQIRERILDHTFQLSSGERGSLQALLRPAGSTPDARRATALGVLDRKVRVGIDKESGVLELVVSAPDAGLAQQVANAYVQELVRIEDELKAATARSNKDFIEKRLTETEGTLRVTEDAFKNFQEENPHLGSDPELQLQAARLERDTRVQEEIYLTLVRQYELAKIEENRQTPGIQVIDPANRPLTRSSPILLKNVALSAFLGFIAASLLVVGLDWWSTARRQIASARTREGLRPGWDVQVPS